MFQRMYVDGKIEERQNGALARLQTALPGLDVAVGLPEAGEMGRKEELVFLCGSREYGEAVAGRGALIALLTPEFSDFSCPFGVEELESLDPEFLSWVYHRHVGLPMEFVRGQGLRLVELDLAAAERFLKLRKEEAEYFREPEGGLGPDARQYVAEAHRLWDLGTWEIQSLPKGERLGFLGIDVPGEEALEALRDWPDRDGDPLELSYYVETGRRGHGVARKAAKMALQEVAGTYGTRLFCCLVEEGNVPSIRTAESLGFRRWKKLKNRRFLYLLELENLVQWNEA